MTWLRRTVLATLVTAIPLTLIYIGVALEDDGPGLWSPIDYVVVPALLLFLPQLLSVGAMRVTLGLSSGWAGNFLFWLACLPASLVYVLLAERVWRRRQPAESK